MRTLTTRCSLALILRDGYTAEPPAPSSVMLRVRGGARKPIRKPDGIWVFTDLDGGDAVIEIESPIYIEQVLTIAPDKLDRLNPTVAVLLAPSRSYPLPSGATVVTAVVNGKDGKPVAGARVEAIVADDRAARARLVADAGAGDRQVEAVRIAGKPAAGDRYVLRSREGKLTERCAIAGYGDDQRKLLLAEPLARQMPRGSLLMPLLAAVTDDRGRARFALRPFLPSPEFALSLEVSHGSRKLEQAVRVLEGRENELEPVVLV